MNNQHAIHEDIFSLCIGILVLSFSLVILKQTGVQVGGLAGGVLLISQLTDLAFGPLFFVVCLPFFLASWFRMSRIFTIKSVLSCGAISYFSELMLKTITIGGLTPLAAAILGGMLCGIGLLILTRHQSSAGGFHVVAIYCQEKFGISAGYLMMGLDFVILSATALFFGLQTLIVSFVCILVMYLILSFNHKPGRYSAGQTLASS